jgi:hypothetical protein
MSQSNKSGFINYDMISQSEKYVMSKKIMNKTPQNPREIPIQVAHHSGIVQPSQHYTPNNTFG